ncbi:hypothetical protein A3Q56_03728 [Intoshia linei]|uniref:Uncharacterized protein n=1 Tax=Intoshia linei TaxID=1819745 RepID=A0A177B334_9BILA|nr:hypothetical protein A3Q56_03728 [Intoshia linei]
MVKKLLSMVMKLLSMVYSNYNGESSRVWHPAIINWIDWCANMGQEIQLVPRTDHPPCDDERRTIVIYRQDDRTNYE